MVDLLSDWLLPSLKTELEQMVRARREQPYGEDSQTYNDIDGEFCIMIRPKSLKVARHVLQICRVCSSQLLESQLLELCSRGLTRMNVVEYLCKAIRSVPLRLLHHHTLCLLRRR